MKEKLLKIKVLVERGGTEGEKQSAKYLLEKLCKKEGIKPEDIKEITDVIVSYSDGIRVQFKNDDMIYDHQFPNGAIVRYYRDGRRAVLQQAVQRVQIRVVDSFDGSTATTQYWGF